MNNRRVQRVQRHLHLVGDQQRTKINGSLRVEGPGSAHVSGVVVEGDIIVAAKRVDHTWTCKKCGAECIGFHRKSDCELNLRIGRNVVVTPTVQKAKRIADRSRLYYAFAWVIMLWMLAILLRFM